MILILKSNCVTDTIGYLQNINENFESIKSIVGISNDTISNEISAVNTMLVVFSVIVGLIGIFLSWYISRVEKKVNNMKDSIVEKEKTIKQIARTVEETDNKIQSDIKGLYEKLRKEESLTLLRRLELEPRDINNLVSLLLARPLEEDGFPILKNAYLKLKNQEGDSAEDEKRVFSLLFFQHYLSLAILDDELRDNLVFYFDKSMNCAFKRDIIKSTNDFCKAMSVDAAPFDKVELLADYLKALNESEFKDLIELKNIFQENLNKDLLVDAIEQCRKENIYLSLFGEFAPNNESEDNNDYTEDE